MLEPYYAIPNDAEIEKERQRRDAAERERTAASKPIPLPRTVAELLGLCERQRRCILDALSLGYNFVPNSIDSFVAVVVGTLPDAVMMPDVRRVVNAALVLGFVDAPSSIDRLGDGSDPSKAIVALDAIAAWCRATNAPPIPVTSSPNKDRSPLTPDERETAVADYLRNHPGEPIKKVSAATGVSVGSINNMQVWKAEMARRNANRSPRVPLERQLRNEGQSSILKDDGLSPGDEAVLNEEDSNGAAWSRILDMAAPKERAMLHVLDEKIQTALIQYARDGHSEDELRELIAEMADSDGQTMYRGRHKPIDQSRSSRRS